jgi:dTMP kinase
MSRGALIAVEGIDGAGSTTLAKRLVAALGEEQEPAHFTCQPSSGPVGKLLREILEGAHKPTDATTLGLLFAADRADHIQREVEPAMAKGGHVVSDRWYHSSLAYQGSIEDRSWIAELNKRATIPDLTVFVRVAPETAAQRRVDDSRTEELFDALETQRRVAAGYEAVLELLRERETIEIIDGEKSADEVFAQAWPRVLETCRMARNS